MGHLSNQKMLYSTTTPSGWLEGNIPRSEYHDMAVLAFKIGLCKLSLA